MTFQDRYSTSARLLHRLAFSTIPFQKALADIEDRLYAGRLAAIELVRPVFITSLPRAGTTLLLELLSGLDSFAAHTYRQMPFVLTPLVWNAVSRRFQTAPVALDRAHGDGMTVGFDTAEAFEEVVWRAFWPEKYLADRIVPWRADDTDAEGEFEPFLKNHMRKLIALRANGAGAPVRYVSKNNANIARIQKITRLFPDAVILVPFRQPLEQVGSMLRQHRRFERIHAQEAFTRRYMEDIGHFDFGANFRPLDFGGWLDRADGRAAHSADFWLEYWCAAFEHVLSQPGAQLIFVSYEQCCAQPAAVLRRLGGRLGLDGTDRLTSEAGRFRAPRSSAVAAPDVGRAVLDRALALHAELSRRAVG